MGQSSDDHDDENFIEKNPLELMFAMFFFNNFNAFFSFLFLCIFYGPLLMEFVFIGDIGLFFLRSSIYYIILLCLLPYHLPQTAVLFRFNHIYGK